MLIEGTRDFSPYRPLRLALAFALALLVRPARADAPSVPPELQVSLLSKACTYDREFRQRAGDTARILVLEKPGSIGSTASADYIKSVIDRLDTFAGIPPVASIARYESAAKLAARCRDERIAVVYLTPGLDDDIEGIRASLTDLDVLTVAAVPAYVEAGAVLGFDLVAGRARLLINLPQARRQHVDFVADVLRLMKMVVR